MDRKISLMTTNKPHCEPENKPKYQSFILLFALSSVIGGFLEWFHLPAALLLGPMIAAIIITIRGARLKLYRPFFLLAQGSLGVMIASHLPLNLYTEVAKDWPVFLLGTLSTVVASSFLGWLLSRTGLLPGTTAIWGSSPGAAGAMTLMCEAYGADIRLVAMMQYLRVACCVVAASVVAHIYNVSSTSNHAASNWLLVSSWQGFGLTLLLIGIASYIGVKLRLPGGPLLISIALGVLLKATGLLTIVLPTWYLTISYGILGWGIGFRFSPEVVRHAAKVFPYVLGSILALLFLNGCFAVLLVYFADIDPLTAFLATSPGGADSVAIIAAATNADVAFVMTMQILRFLLVLIIGPLLARWLSAKRPNETAL
ncbi:Putative ammonia monooxygenase [Marinomonas spartinae]|uniref:Putative ammonia monooxygenase n=2 Tax=Marinomonas spartinae TaxID=1792290 RepID=A0A1A8T404_9GAMM|nr:Putative ammonia monooxygenase [Marinomonas spartinae]SBS40226.1 Putative ammonia monooxygenase [Marinomonas spartinae]